MCLGDAGLIGHATESYQICLWADRANSQSKEHSTLFICVGFHTHTLTSSLCHTNICLPCLLMQANADDSRGVIVMIYVVQQHIG